MIDQWRGERLPFTSFLLLAKGKKRLEDQEGSFKAIQEVIPDWHGPCI
jgi:hypothetical protein